MHLYLFNILHHDIFNFRNLSFHLSKLAYLFRVLNTVLHMFLQLGPTASNKNKVYNYIFSKTTKITTNPASSSSHITNSIPKFFVQAVRGRSRGLPATVFRHKIILRTLQKSHRHLSPNRFIRNNTISYKKQVCESDIHFQKHSTELQISL